MMLFNKLTAAALLMVAASAQAEPAYHLYVPGRQITPHLAPAAKEMLYYGGPVLASSQTVTVIWGRSVAASTVAQIGPFLQALGNSTFVDLLGQYSTNIKSVTGKQGTDQTIVRGTYLGQFKIIPKNKHKVLSDKDVQTELLGQIAAGKLPAATLNALYMIYFPADITIKLGTAKSCVDFGAYHEAVSAKVTPGNVFYGVMPDCDDGFGAYLTFASSHEFAEATTDAIPTPGSNPAYPQAWNNAEGYEIADLCEGAPSSTLTTSTTAYTVTQVWDNTTNNCSTGTYTSP